MSDEKKKREISEAALQQYFIADASYIIVVCSDTTQVVRSYDNRGLMYSRQQAGAAIENMLLKATELGLASCWVGAFDEEKIKTILQIPEKINVEVILPIGNPVKREKPRKKPPLNLITYFEKWKQKMVKPLKKAPAY